MSGMARLLAPLDAKLLRELRAMWGQALAIGLVIAAGVALAVAMYGMLASLALTREAYYERYRFADVWAPVERAPRHVVRDLARIPGVRTAADRIVGSALVDVPGMMEPAHAKLVSIPDDGPPPLNAFARVSGRLPDPRRPAEALLDADFAEAHGLAPGDRLAAVVHGRRQDLRVVGTAMSPEFTYVLAPGEVAPDPRRAGVLWMSRAALEAAYDLDGAFNEAVLALRPDAREAAVLAAVDRVLARYGGTGAYGRDAQVSDRFLVEDMTQLRSFGALVVPVFLLVAGFLLGTVLGRLVDIERPQIGLLKAFGYTDAAVGLHYLKLALAITLAGIALGFAVGTRLGHGLAGLYAEVYSFPFLFYRVDPATYALAALSSLAAALLGTLGAVRRAARLAPATAMEPPSPTTFRRALVERLIPPALLGAPGRMVVRQITRRPVRAGVTVAGIAASLALLIGSSFSLDSVDRLLDRTFFQAERQDMTFTFAEARPREAIRAVERLPGVLAAEPFRTVAARLSNGAAHERIAITGLVAAPRLNRMLDAADRPVAPPPAGLMLSDYLAGKLGVAPGDTVAVEILEGRRPRVDLTVTAVVELSIGTGAFMALPALNRLMREGAVVSGAHVLLDETDLPALFAAVKETPLLAGASLKASALANVRTQIEENMATSIVINTIFAGFIAFGVAYNAARLTFAERARELASLRVLGFTRGEVAAILAAELAVLTLLAIPLGWILGMAISWTIATGLTTELFRIPFVARPATYGWTTLAIVAAAAVSGALVVRRVGRLDLVEVLKTRG